MHSHTYLSTVPAVVPAPEEVEGLQTAMAFLSVHIRHPAGRLCTRQQKTTGTLEYLPMCCICRYVLYIQVTPLLLGNSATVMLWSSSGEKRPEHHDQTIGRIFIHLQAGTSVLCILRASGS